MSSRLSFSSTGDAALGFFDKLDQVRDLRGVRSVGRLERTEGGGEVAVLFEEEFFVGGLEGFDVVLGKAATLETDQVEAAGVGGIAVDNHEGRHVLDNLGAAANNRMLADAAELVDRTHAGNDGMIFNDDVAGDANGVGKDDVAAELAVVGDVGVAEQQIMRADAGGQAFVGAAVDGGVFAKNVVVADFEVSGIAEVFEILGLAADDGEGEKLVAAADLGMTFENDVGVQDAIVAEFNMVANDAIGANADILSQGGERRNNSSRVNHDGNFEV